MFNYDVVIIGGGPAGLSAALVLGRCRRNVLVYDSQFYRNANSKALHGFLTRDGIDPAELRRIGQEQLEPYKSVIVTKEKVIHAEKNKHGFQIKDEKENIVNCKMLLLATGIVDEWPKIKGAEPMYGHSIFHCPYCDGWEVRDQPFAILGHGEKAGEAALQYLQWSCDVVLCTDGPAEISDKIRALLVKHHILIREEKITELRGQNGFLEEIVFEEGDPLQRRVLFFSARSPQKSNLAEMLGCQFDEEGSISVDFGKFESKNIHNLFIAGDATPDTPQAIAAAAAGAEAAIAINTRLIKETYFN